MDVELTVDEAAAVRDAVGEWFMAGLMDGWDTESIDAVRSGVEKLKDAVRKHVRESGGF